jgi:hypothetical protein
MISALRMIAKITNFNLRYMKNLQGNVNMRFNLAYTPNLVEVAQL